MDRTEILEAVRKLIDAEPIGDAVAGEHQVLSKELEHLSTMKLGRVLERVQMPYLIYLLATVAQ